MGNFVVFDSWKRGAMTGGTHNLSATMRCALLSGVALLSIDTSTVASAVARYATSASAGDADRRVNPPGDGNIADQFTKTADGVIKFDLSDVAFTATTGQNLNVGVGVIYQSAAQVPVGQWQISTVEVAASQFTVNWPAEGLFETSDNG